MAGNFRVIFDIKLSLTDQFMEIFKKNETLHCVIASPFNKRLNKLHITPCC